MNTMKHLVDALNEMDNDALVRLLDELNGLSSEQRDSAIAALTLLLIKCNK